VSEKKKLVVAIRGWINSDDFLLAGQPGGEFPQETLETLRADLPDVEVWAPDVDLTMFSMRHPEAVAVELFQLIEDQVSRMPKLESIVLMGYSAGSVLARRVFCMAHGAGMNACLDPACAAPWAPLVHRLVVLAGITRGWQLTTASPDHVRFLSPLLFGLARLVGWLKSLKVVSRGRLPFIWELKRGSPFIISTRLQYVEVMRQLRAQRDSGSLAVDPLRANAIPSTVFMLGAKDEYISPADCTELGPRAEFAYVELPGSNHAKVMHLVPVDDPKADAATRAAERTAADLRRERIVNSLKLSFRELLEEDWVLPPGDIDDYLDPMDVAEAGAEAAADADLVAQAVMVVHGIRDNGFWTKRVAREVKTQARAAKINVRAPSPSYGFFSMWDFVKPGGRKHATHWFMERYADVRSHFPNAAISFVGHSNGTYIAAHALEICPAIRFERIVFAGSVVRQDYPWGRRQDQVKSVLNYVGNADSVVAFLPAVFEYFGLRWLDVGGAGAFGFADTNSPPARRRLLGTGPDPVELTEVRFVSGGHGAAIDEQFWPEIATFVLTNQPPSRPSVPRGRHLAALFACAPVVTSFFVLMAIAVLILPVFAVAAVAALAGDGWNRFLSMSFGDWVMSDIIANTYLWSALLTVAATVSVSWLVGRFLRAW
jgi:pimeloyl-ACP methyl ester carboxylesterase